MATLDTTPTPKMTFQETTAPSSAPSGDQYVYIDSSDHKLKRKNSSGTVTTLEPGAGSDTTAVHTGTASEIHGITEKTTPVSADVLLIEDSADSYNKKRLQVGNLPSGSGGGSTIHTSAYSSPPASPASGDIWLPSDSFYQFRYSGSAWIPWGPLFPMTLPVLADFTWVNQGSATAAQTYGAIQLSTPATSGYDMKILKKAAPSTPYTITTAVIPNVVNQNYPNCGLLFRQSSDGKINAFRIVGQTNQCYLSGVKYTNATTYSADYTPSVNIDRPPLLWLRISDNGTNRICSWSLDGHQFMTMHTVGRTDYLTADEVGFFVESQNSTWGCDMTLLSWAVT